MNIKEKIKKIRPLEEKEVYMVDKEFNIRIAKSIGVLAKARFNPISEMFVFEDTQESVTERLHSLPGKVHHFSYTTPEEEEPEGESKLFLLPKGYKSRYIIVYEKSVLYNIANTQIQLNENPFLLSNVDNEIYKLENIPSPASSLLEKKTYYVYPTLEAAQDEKERRTEKVKSDALYTIERAKKYIDLAKERIDNEGPKPFTVNDRELEIGFEYVAVSSKLKPLFKFIPERVDEWGFYRDGSDNLLEPSTELLEQNDVAQLAKKGKQSHIVYDYLDLTYLAEYKLKQLKEAFGDGEKFDHRLVRNIIRETNDAIRKL